MRPKYFLPSLGAMLLAGLSSLPVLPAAEAGPGAQLLLKKGARVAILGDSITEAMCYSRYIDLYLAACRPDLDVSVMHVGRSGAAVSVLPVWDPLLLLPYKPDLVTVCFGMNDGGYSAPSSAVAQAYANNLKTGINPLIAAGATVVVGSPGAVDTHYFKGLRSPHNPGEDAVIYNQTLAGLRDEARAVATSEKMPFANIHDAMISTMEKAKAALGDDYAVCADGIHPYPAGHLIMAYVFLKAMGLDGDIGTITVDMDGKATATEGHNVLASDKGTVQLESTRYPFCFDRDEKAPTSNRSILPFLPFNQDLNRLVLVVKNLKSEKAKVTWGSTSKSFSRKELEAGINLSDAFAGDNPFKENFKKADAAVLAKEAYETQVKSSVASMANLLKEPGDEGRVDKMRKLLYGGIAKKNAEIRAILAPVKHTLTVVPE